MKKDIHHTIATNKCRLSDERVENVDHVLASGKILGQNNTNEELTKSVSLCTGHYAESLDICYNHTPEKVLCEAGKPKILWDFNIQTDRIMEHRRPDIIAHDVEKENFS